MSPSAQDPAPATAKSALAPTGRLRVGVNLGNFLLVSKQSADGVGGIVPDLAQELARRLGVAFELVLYPAAGPVADAAKTGAWDVAFIGAEPQRASEIDFTEPYIEIEATYLVPAGSPIRSIAEVDRKGVRIAVANRSAYDLWLARNIKQAELVRAEGIEGSWQLFLQEKLDVLAGLKPRLLQDREKLPGSRILEGRFTAVQQAIGTPKGRPAAAAYLREFARDIKSSGLVAQLIERHNVRGVTVA
ncbi:MAG TPA: ABC transporter substrate-binding protein [Burkholderiales bacterium]|nr:ABC transporter substrate-binding protein [Burkholderiales bacterium]